MGPPGSLGRFTSRRWRWRWSAECIEVPVIEPREMLTVRTAGAGLRQVGATAGLDRKTARRYTDELIGGGGSVRTPVQ